MPPPNPASLGSYNWFPGSNGNGGGQLITPFEQQVSDPRQQGDIVEYSFINDINGWTNPGKFLVTPDGVYLGPIILPPTWPNPSYIVRCKVIMQDGGGEMYVFLDRKKRYYNTGKPRGAESGTLQDICTLFHQYIVGPFSDKWDFPPVFFDRNIDGLCVNFTPTAGLVTSWFNVEFNILVPTT